MLSIHDLTVEGTLRPVVTDNPAPVFGYYCESDKPNNKVVYASLDLDNGSHQEMTEKSDFVYSGKALEPFTTYKATLTVKDAQGETATATVSFETGRLATPWVGKPITDTTYSFTEKKVSPQVMTFHKSLDFAKKIVSAKLYATALGTYRINLNGKKVGPCYLAPGFTSYRYHLMYQTYDVKDLLQAHNDLVIHVAGGWAVGSFVFTRVNRQYAKRQCLLMELRVQYEDGSQEVIPSDTSFDVTTKGPYQMADIYDGETIDLTQDILALPYHKSGLEKVSIHPEIVADYSCPIVRNREMIPVILRKEAGKTLYDFKQNFSGIVSLKIHHAKKGQTIVVHHAEVLTKEGELNLSLLRSAKATLTIHCKDGDQEYAPEFTYMGFRYISVEGIAPEDVEVIGYHLTSDLPETGSFHCSNEMLNQLDHNIRWSARSNFMDIPTDCPQRDERMGWTGDVSIFGPTACYDFQMKRFLIKWLKDVRSEQLPTGGVPNTVPCHGYKFPATMPKMAVDFWGDAIVTVPYCLYLSYADKGMLERMYPAMMKYVNACKFWARIWGVGEYRYIWHTPSMLHFGDWVAPDIDKMSAWQKRSMYTATASLRRTTMLLSKIASYLGKNEDADRLIKYSDKVAKAYSDIFLDKETGKLKKQEFQTGYVLPIHFEMLTPEMRTKAIDNLVSLIEKNNYKIGTGFPGTPYILYALADNGHSDVAYKMLLNTEAPSWLYNVKVGGTTIWEKFDGQLADGTARPSTDGTGNMISFNHYALGSVGNFLYTRLAGVRILEPGYRRFLVKPVLGGGITSCETTTLTPNGPIHVAWKVEGKTFTLTVHVPMGTESVIGLPNGKEKVYPSGDVTETVSLA